MKQVIRLLLIPFLLSLLFCSSPPSLNNNQIQQLTVPLLYKKDPKQIKGSGYVVIKVEGKRYGGNVDLIWQKNSFFHADFYSPMGTVVAYINGDTNSGTFKYNGQDYTFGVDSTMDSLPFNWGKYFTFNEFANLLTGNLSSIVEILNTSPDSIKNYDKTTSSIWNNDSESFIITAQINRKKMVVNKITLSSKNNQDYWTMVFGKFNNGIAQSILFKENENNYFSIDYDRLNYF